MDEVAQLTAHNRREREVALERRLLALRHEAGVRRCADAPDAPRYAAPDADALAEGAGLPEHSPHNLSPGLLRAGIMRDGCVLVRGLLGRAEAMGVADEIERGFAECDRVLAGGSAADGYYEPFEPAAEYEIKTRPWVREGGGVLAFDSPRLAFQMLELFEAASV